MKEMKEMKEKELIVRHETFIRWIIIIFKKFQLYFPG